MLPAVVTRNYIGRDDVKTWLKRGNSAVAKACFPLLIYVPQRLTGVKVRHANTRSYNAFKLSDDHRN